MEGARIAFSLEGADLSAPRPSFKVIVDESEFVTSCALADDIAHLLDRFTEMAGEGSRFDLFFSGAYPYSVSVLRRDGGHYLRITDNFDGTVLEEWVRLGDLRAALVDFVDEWLSGAGRGMPAEAGMRENLRKLREWPGPTP